MDSKTKREIALKKALNENYAIISFRIDGTIKYANEKFLTLFGYKLNEIENKHHKILCDKNYAHSKEYDKFWQDLLEGNIQNEEFKRIKKNKDSVFIQASYKPLLDDEGKVFEILKFAQDITERKLQNLNYAGQIQAINKSQAVIEFSLDGKILTANDNFLEIFAFDLDEVVGKHHSIFVEDPYKNSMEYKNFWKKLNEGRFDSGEYLRIAKNGRRVWIQATYNPIFNIDNKLIKIVKFAQDITQDKLSSLYHTGQLEAINKSQSVIEFDMSGKILNANENFLKAMNYSLEEIKGKHHSIFVEDSYKNSMEYKSFWDKLNEGNFDTGKYLRLGKNGKKVWIQATYTPILDIDKKPIKVVKFAQDITEFEIVKKDQLTGLYNREKLLIDIEENIENSLAIIEINNFSFISDFYGYKVGDELLVKFSKILIDLVDKDFIVYRSSVDKFAVLNSKVSHKKFLSFINQLLNKLKNTFVNLEIDEIHLLTTCGVSFESKEKLLNTAEIVNKYAKKNNKDLLIYSNDLNIEKEYVENIKWTEKIKLALNEDRIIVYYQPIYNNTKKKIEKYEALVRLQDTNGEIISPFMFLDIAKKSRQYLDITKRVIHKSFEKFKDEPYEFSINLTVEDIFDEDLKKYLFSKIEEYKIANRLVLELVESEKITIYEPVYEFINKVKDLGCKVAIDDFGSGYSNFEYLVKINADYVKIDGSIIKRILEDENSLEIVKSILTFSKKMKIKTIAEFISSKELFDKVSGLGVDYSQGFYLGKPQEDL
ncbi:hypothetical protein CP965_08695 [Halarcobacter mediterraneus]|uniref:Diguanylate cyclase n=1 Tax=Halarcobacter mediterraneus TaxID=2023153 RepID=A0A4Q1ATW4_9BACT|nr:EAL domain-containing protein [Halarcobacter mediterraneus]RXK12647.1 hypothetical protein CP965_08695 [Halarcobacter mediterraneus]